MQSYSREEQLHSKGTKNKIGADICDNIRNAYDYAKDLNETYTKNLKMVFCRSLTDADVGTLEGTDRPTLTFSIISPILKHQLKNITESIPESSVIPVESDTDPNDDQTAKALTAKLQSIYEYNRYPDIVGEAAELAGTGGRAVFKLYTDYINNVGFEQCVKIKSVEDPTMIFFDPCAIKMTKEDADYVYELSYISVDAFKRDYKHINIEDVEAYSRKYAGVGISWVREREGQKTVAIIDYCYKSYTEKNLYLVRGDFGDEITEEKPEDESLILAERTTNDVEIKHMRICGDLIIEQETTLNFKCLPYVAFYSDRKIIAGKEVVTPFAEAAIDAQRAKNIAFNSLFFEMINNSTGRFMVAQESMTDSLEDVIANPASKKNLVWKSRDDVEGVPVNNPPPEWMPQPPIPASLLEVFQSMDTTINTILGSQYYSLDQTNMSGKALYNLADFMNASISTLMKNLIITTAQIGRVILSALPFLYEQQEIDISNSNQEKNNVTIDYNETDIERFSIQVTKGANYALQQQVTVESMLEYAKASPAFAQWLNTAGIPILLANTPLNGKNKIIESYEEFTQKAMAASQNQPNPEQIKIQAMQAELQLKMHELSLKEQELALKAKQAAADSAIDLNKAQIQREQGSSKMAVDVYQQQSENQRELLRHYKEV